MSKSLSNSLPGGTLPDFSHETAIVKSGGGLVAGVDEAGRGPWAGPVVVAAVILDPDDIPAGLKFLLEPGDKAIALALLNYLHQLRDDLQSTLQAEQLAVGPLRAAYYRGPLSR